MDINTFVRIAASFRRVGVVSVDGNVLSAAFVRTLLNAYVTHVDPLGTPPDKRAALLVANLTRVCDKTFLHAGKQVPEMGDGVYKIEPGTFVGLCQVTVPSDKKPPSSSSLSIDRKKTWRSNGAPSDDDGDDDDDDDDESPTARRRHHLVLNVLPEPYVAKCMNEPIYMLQNSEVRHHSVYSEFETHWGDLFTRNEDVENYLGTRCAKIEYKFDSQRVIASLRRFVECHALEALVLVGTFDTDSLQRIVDAVGSILEVPLFKTIVCPLANRYRDSVYFMNNEPLERDNDGVLEHFSLQSTLLSERLKGAICRWHELVRATVALAPLSFAHARNDSERRLLYAGAASRLYYASGAARSVELLHGVQMPVYHLTGNNNNNGGDDVVFTGDHVARGSKTQKGHVVEWIAKRFGARSLFKPENFGVIDACNSVIIVQANTFFYH